MPVMEKLNRPLLLMAVLLVAGACAPTGRPIAGSGGSADPFAGQAAAPRDVRLEVHNLNFNDVRLYVLSGGARRRIGEIGALQDQTFDIPWEFTDRMRIEMDIVTGPTCVTREIRVDPGQILQLQIESRPERLFICRG